MPKKRKDFPGQLSLNVADDLRVKLIALGYLQGSGGEYAAPARNILTEGVERVIRNMDEHQRARFDEILTNVRLIEAGEKALL